MFENEFLLLKAGQTPPYAKESCDIYFYIIDKEDYHKQKGYICVQNTNFKKGTVTIGFKTYKKFRNQGIMKRALRLFLYNIFEFLSVKVIYADCAEKNKISFNLLDSFMELVKEESNRIYFRLKFGDI